jgi:hypothetical protein
MVPRLLLPGSQGLLAAAPSGFPEDGLGHAGQQAFPIILIHLFAIGCLVLMYLHFRHRDDADLDEGEDWGGGGGPGPGPKDDPARDLPEPPLGAIRARRVSSEERLPASTTISR